MIKVQNVTPIKEIKQAVKDGYLEIEQIDCCKWRVVNKVISYNPLEYTLEFMNSVNKWKLSYSDKYDKFTVRFLSYGDIFEIYCAIYNGKNERSDSRLKKYKRACCMANCFIKSGLCKIALSA